MYELVKKVLGAAMATAITLTLTIPVFAVQSETTNAVGESVDRGGRVTRVDIPNGDGTFTSLEGTKAQEWYNRAVAEGEKRAKEDKALMNIQDRQYWKEEIPLFISILILSLSLLMVLKGQNQKNGN